MKRDLLILVGIIFCMLAGHLYAAANPWSFKGGVSYIETGGNSRARTASVDSDLKYAGEGIGVSFLSGLVFSTQDETTSAESYYIKEKTDLRLKGKTYLYESFGWSRDVFSGIDAKYSLQAGMGHGLGLLSGLSLDLESGMDYTFENRTGLAREDYGSFRAAALCTYVFSQTGRFTQELESLFNVTRAEDYRLNSTTSVLSEMNKNLALKVSYTVKFDHDPVPGFSDTDRMFSAAVVLKL